MDIFVYLFIWFIPLSAVIPAARSQPNGHNPQPNNGLPQTPSQQSTPDCKFTKELSYIPSAARKNAEDFNDLALLHRMQANVLTADECAQLCCEYGPDCEYAWLYESDCYAVGCYFGEESFCEPYLDSGADMSTYIEVQRLASNPLDSSNKDYQEEHMNQYGHKYTLKPSVTMALFSESMAPILASPVSIITVTGDPLHTLLVQPATETPQPLHPPTSSTPEGTHEPPGDDEPVDEGRPSISNRGHYCTLHT